MTIITNTTDRKQMVREISEHLGIPAVYLRTPTYAFQIGKLTVNRDASISAEETADLDAIRPFLIDKGYIEAFGPHASEPTATNPEAQEQPPEVPAIQKLTEEITQMDISIPHEGMNMNALRNFIFTLYSKQHLLNKALMSDLLFIHENVVNRLQEYLPEDIDGFIELLEDFRGLDELSGITFTNENITMSFPFNGQPTLDLAFFPDLLSHIIKNCKETGRVRPKLQQLGDNEKYLMHSWLIRLGCGGPDFKALRMRMTRGLTGYCAFPDQARAEKHKNKYAEIRRNLRVEQRSDEVSNNV